MSGGELPFCLLRVVRAVPEDVLSPGHKLLWADIFELSRRPEGCTATAEQHARRLGMGSARTVETLRWELEHFGILRRASGRRAWYCTAPRDCVPTNLRPTDAEVFASARQLADFLRPSVKQRKARFHSVTSRGAHRGSADGETTVSTGDSASDSSDANPPGRVGEPRFTPTPIAVHSEISAGGRRGSREAETPAGTGYPTLTEARADASPPRAGEVEVEVEGEVEKGEDTSPPSPPPHKGEAVARAAEANQERHPSAVLEQRPPLDPVTRRLMEHHARRRAELAGKPRAPQRVGHNDGHPPDWHEDPGSGDGPAASPIPQALVDPCKAVPPPDPPDGSA